MTVHPCRPNDPDDESFEVASQEVGMLAADLGALLDLRPDRFEGLDQLIDGLDDARDRFGSFDRDHVLARRAVAPGLLAGFCWLDLELCGAFHAAMFGLLEDIGDSGGLIATSSYFADVGVDRMRGADAWLHENPAPTEGDDPSAARAAIAAHSRDLAVALGSNPSLTFASTAALREPLIDGHVVVARVRRAGLGGRSARRGTLIERMFAFMLLAW